MNNEYFLIRNGTRQGPYSIGQLKDQINRREVMLSDMAWVQGRPNWSKINEMPEVLDAIIPPMPTGTPSGSPKAPTGNNQNPPVDSTPAVHQTPPPPIVTTITTKQTSQPVPITLDIKSNQAFDYRCVPEFSEKKEYNIGTRFFMLVPLCLCVVFTIVGFGVSTETGSKFALLVGFGCMMGAFICVEKMFSKKTSTIWRVCPVCRSEVREEKYWRKCETCGAEVGKPFKPKE